MFWRNKAKKKKAKPETILDMDIEENLHMLNDSTIDIVFFFFYQAREMTSLKMVCNFFFRT